MVGCIFALLFMVMSLNRYASLKDFILQASEESSNQFLTWFITSLVFIVALSTLISQYIPIVPREIASIKISGFQLNKFGFTFLTLSLFYLVRMVLTYLLFSSIDNARNWKSFYFAATKFYFVASLVLIIANFAHYYFYIDKNQAFAIYILALAFLFVFKQFYYLFYKDQILPNSWYYKFLYICTLQIVPVLVLWKFLF